MRSKLIPPLLGYYTMAGGAAPVATPWYLTGGIPAANCIAAYQAKGAADYAASKVNLANPGTYNLADVGGAVTFDTAVGWSGFATLSRCLNTGIANVIKKTWTIIIRVSGVTSNSTVMFGAYEGASDGMYFSYATATGWGYFMMSSDQPNVAGSGNAVLAVASGDYYLDGVDKGNFSSQSSVNTLARTPYLGALHSASTVQYTNGSIQAASIYNVTLTGTQVGLVTTAMAAL